MSYIAPQYDGLFDVKYYGAIGDGVADDTQAFVDCFTAAVAGSGHVRIPAGRFALTGATADAAITMQNIRGLTIHGVDKYASVITHTADNVETCLFAFVDCEDIEIAHLGFDGRVTTNTRVAWNRAIDARGVLRLDVWDTHSTRTGNSAHRVAHKGLPGSDAIPHGTRQSESVLFHHNRIEEAYGSGGILTKSAGAKVLTISDNIFERLGIQAISVEAEDPVVGTTTIPAGELTVTNNIIKDTDAPGRGASSASWGITCQELMKNVTIADNTLLDIKGQASVAGINVTTSATQSDTLVERINVHDNMIDGVTAGSTRKPGIRLSSSDENLQNVSLKGNQVYGVEYGVELRPNAQGGTGGEIRDIKISDNEFDVSKIGVWYNSPDGGVAPLRDSQITDNKIAAVQLGIQLLAEDCQVTGNHIRFAERGVGMLGGSTNNEVWGNPVRGNTLPEVNLNGEIGLFPLGEHWVWFDSTGTMRRESMANTKPTTATIDTAGQAV